ncbi:CHAT domain-containing protein [Alkalinema sp. FACHB-956]|uniref:CHAT domain-containing protein n=1 Tax=Alkalinema sp. FACHB-956 TaxID=2692768 RepID=UPI001686AC89|nr:CHAT domain-containing protein [Alkalinema sp. FACHB-956]MBD2326736.1 CHAT domain-containing protein [Alkalinema sp. FACHB-956]
MLFPGGSWAQSITPTIDGTGTQVTPTGTTIDISGGTQNGGNLFHSFQQFNVGADQTANFLTQPTVQNILGRIVGGDASLINGKLQVTGSHANLFLINPAGILFGQNATLNVPGSFTATTADRIGFSNGQGFNAIGANDYATLLGQPIEFQFSALQPGSVINTGNLTVNAGQSLALLGGTVVNTGTLTAPNGKITIASTLGNQTLRIQPDGSLLGLEIPLNDRSTVNNSPIAAKSLPELLTGGEVATATGLTVENGLLKLTQNSTNNTSLVPVQSGTTIVSGSVSTSGSQAQDSRIQILGDRVGLINAQVQATGATGGGTVLIGGDYQGQGPTPTATATFVDRASTINANAINNGNGGKIIVWANGNTKFAGTATARGGQLSGNGGLIETSGKQFLDITQAQVDASAPQGQVGTWLLDPTDINIINDVNGGGNLGTISNGIFDPPTTGVASQIAPATIETALNNGTNVTITTASGTGGNGDITLTDSINQLGGGSASLTLIGRNFLNPNGATINLSSTGGLTFKLNQINPQPNPTAQSIQTAIQSIGTVNGPRSIELGAGIYRTDVPIVLDRSVNLSGAGIGSTVISGNQTTQVFTVASNDVTNSAGVIASLANLTIQDGRSLNGADGGGILNAGTLTLSKVAVTNNVASGAGGGIANTGSLTLDQSLITNNQANNGGGGISTSAGTVDITNSTIANNQANGVGGGVKLVFKASLNVTSSTFNNNFATANGGALDLNSDLGIAAATLVNVTLSGNTVNNAGGGVSLGQSQQAVLDSVTIANNQAANGGGGISNLFGGTLTLKNTIVAGNRAPINPDVQGSLTSQGNNLVQNRGTSIGYINSDLPDGTAPNLSPLGNYGGLTATHVPLAGSPAIDAGNTTLTIDQRGVIRPSGINSDIGAVEVETLPPTPPVVAPIAPAPGLPPTAPPAPAEKSAPSGIQPPELVRSNPIKLAPSRMPASEMPASEMQGPVMQGPMLLSPIELERLDDLFSQDYRQFLSLSPTPEIGLNDIQTMLQQAQTQKKKRPAIIYGRFTPNRSTASPIAQSTVNLTGFQELPLQQSSPTDRLELLLLTPQGNLIRKETPFTRQQVRDRLQALNLFVSDVEDVKTLPVFGQEFYQWLLQPLVPELQQQQINQLIYSLDADLRLLPLSLLHNGKTYAIQDYQISLIPSVGLMDRTIVSQRRSVLASGAETFQRHVPLPAAAVEVKLVSQELGSGKVLLNEAFTVKNLLKTRSTFPANIVHLATHAAFNPGALSRSYIQFWDRKLTLDQLRSLNLDHPPIDLLVLSACSTAVGDRTSELGFAGLAAAAGVRSTLGSLWPVSDLGTLAFMSEFYGHLNHTFTRSAALQATQVAMQSGKVRIEQGHLITSYSRFPLPQTLLEQGITEFSHPYYWGAFTLIGNPW